MRLLADENVPGEAVRVLRERGHDVLWARVASPGAPDAEVIQRATTDGRLLLTLDKGFGELAFRAGVRAPAGVMLLRIEPQAPDRIAAAALAALDLRADWGGCFAVVEEGRVRIVALPDGGEPLRNGGR
jgi:predicted nuclease of predicted toxin-antitoxin system